VRKGVHGGISEYGFPNGLAFCYYRTHPIQDHGEYDLPVGSRHEGYGESDGAPAEHMNFILTTAAADQKELVSHGASWNGTTSDDRTNYFEPLRRPTTTCVGRSAEADRDGENAHGQVAVWTPK